MFDQRADGQPEGQSEPRVVPFSEFTKFNAPTFGGKPDPDAAERWMEKLTGIFRMLNCVER